MPRKPKRASAKAMEATTALAVVQSQAIKLDELHPRYTKESNPNKMDDEKFTLLVEAIKYDGFDQPILVSPRKGGGFLIEDGHHRFWAAKEAGLTHISAIVKPLSDARGRLRGIGMNRLRGDLDLGTAAAEIKAVQEETQWELPQISILTGFTQGELEALLSAIPDPEQMLEDVVGATPDEDDKPLKPFLLEITFATKEDLKLVRRRLKKAAGKGNDLSTGILNLLGEKSSADEDEDDEEGDIDVEVE